MPKRLRKPKPKLPAPWPTWGRPREAVFNLSETDAHEARWGKLLIYEDAAPRGWTAAAVAWQDSVLPMPKITLESEPANASDMPPPLRLTFALRTLRVRQENHDLQDNVLQGTLRVVRRSTGDLDFAQLQALYEQSERRLRVIAEQVRGIVEQLRWAMLYLAACHTPAPTFIKAGRVYPPHNAFQSILEDLAEAEQLSWQECEANIEVRHASDLGKSNWPRLSTETPLDRLHRGINECLKDNEAKLNLLLLTEHHLRITDEAPAEHDLADHLLSIWHEQTNAAAAAAPLPEEMFDWAREQAPAVLVLEVKHYCVGFLEHLMQHSFDRVAVLHKEAAESYERLVLADKMMTPGYQPPQERPYNMVERIGLHTYRYRGKSVANLARLIKAIHDLCEKDPGCRSDVPVKDQPSFYGDFIQADLENEAVYEALKQARAGSAKPISDAIRADAHRIYNELLGDSRTRR